MYTQQRCVPESEKERCQRKAAWEPLLMCNRKHFTSLNRQKKRKKKCTQVPHGPALGGKGEGGKQTRNTAGAGAAIEGLCEPAWG